MVPTDKQKEICDLIIEQASYWKNTNDLYSSTHFVDVEESLNRLDDLTEEQFDKLHDALTNLFWIIRTIK
jgi:hypothetical protein